MIIYAEMQQNVLYIFKVIIFVQRFRTFIERKDDIYIRKIILQLVITNE